MGLFDFFKQLFGAGKETGEYEPTKSEWINVPQKKPKKGKARWGLDELCRRLDMKIEDLTQLAPSYDSFGISKRSGGKRIIMAPKPQLKQLQRIVLRRILSRLKSHPNVTGFEKGHSIVTNANPHVGSAVVLRMDVKDFFKTTSAKRIYNYFINIGWDKPAAELLTKICTYQKQLPQGAPTSPRLSNLVNYRIDCRLSALSELIGAAYTRYADDITFSFNAEDRGKIAVAIRITKKVLSEFGYRLHQKRKLVIRRKHQRQKVTGLVVNEKVALPRKTRRWLRAVEHHLANGREASLTAEQLKGWKSLQQMIASQSQVSE